MRKEFSFDVLFSFVGSIASEEQAVQALKIIERQKYLTRADRLELEQIALEKYYFFQENA